MSRGRHDGRRAYDLAYVWELIEVPVYVLALMALGLLAYRLMGSLT